MSSASRSIALVLALGFCLGASLNRHSAVDEIKAIEEAKTLRPAGRRAISADPFALLTTERLLETLGDLTSIRPYNGWRNSTTRGEEEAISWVEDHLSRMGFLRALGLEVKRQHFRTYLGIEFHETRVELRSNGPFMEVPAQAPTGHRERIDLALNFDSDGTLNDSHPDPVVVEGGPIVIRSESDLDALNSARVAGRVVLLDYELIDRVVHERDLAIERAWRLAELQPAGIVMVTSFSNQRGMSHGSFATDLPAFTWVDVEPTPPVLLVRLEDLAAAGVEDWSDLADLTRVRLTWDVDLYSPGNSSLVMARIPGRDSSRAIILGAHIDSPNTPGAFDNGSGSAALVEVARVLDRSRTIPPVDLHLVWFGSHERGLYGSAVFASSHSELIDRSIAILQMDCLGSPVDGLSNAITVESWPYGRFGDDRITWPSYLQGAASDRGIPTEAITYYGLGSDNGNFFAYNLPSANLIFMDPYDVLEVHYDNHLHDPYDTVELAEGVGDVYRQMAQVLLTAALDTVEDDPQLRVTPEPTRRALFVGSHTEAAHMSASSFTEFGMALAWEGIDVDSIPYGQALTAADLEHTDLVIALPVHDYPSADGDLSLYDEAWTTEEIDLLEDWVGDGGLLLLTNSARRLKYVNYAYEENEDWDDVNDLAERFGIEFTAGGLVGTTPTITSNHRLVAGFSSLQLVEDNGVRFTASAGEHLAQVDGIPVLSMVAAGAGEVLVVSDLGVLGAPGGQAPNLEFWRNVAEYVANR